MQKALAIISHAIRMLIFETGTTFRVVLPGFALVVAASIAAYVLAPSMMQELAVRGEIDHMIQGGDVLALFLMMIGSIVGYSLMAIFWHRHVLLPRGDDQPSARAVGVTLVLYYIWKAIQVGMVEILAAIPAGIVLAILIAALGLGDPGVAPFATMSVLTFVIGIYVIWIGLRISLILPAAALGTRFGIAESWRATAPLQGALWLVALAMVAISSLLPQLTALLSGGSVLAAGLIGTLFYLVQALIFVSILTTLYGHLAENRPLN
jgi:hypothetical protein